MWHLGKKYSVRDFPKEGLTFHLHITASDRQAHICPSIFPLHATAMHLVKINELISDYD